MNYPECGKEIPEQAKAQEHFAVQNQFMDSVRSHIMHWANEAELGTVDVIGALAALQNEYILRMYAANQQEQGGS